MAAAQPRTAQWDDGWYLTNSLVMFDALGQGGLPAYVSRYLTIIRFKAPLITVLPTPIYFVLGRHPRAAYLVNIASMALLFFALSAIAKRFRGGRTGPIAVFLAATMPLLYGLSHWFLVEYMLTTTVCFTVYLLLEALDRPSAKILFHLGVVCGLSVLLKVTFPVYVLLPVLYVLVRLTLDRQWSFRSATAFFAPLILLPLPWYTLNYQETIRRAVFIGFSKEAEAAYGAPF